MTRPDFYEGLHPQLDCDLVAKREDAYMTKLEGEVAELMALLKDGSGLLMDSQIHTLAVREDLDQRDRFEAALQRIIDMPRKMRTGKLCRQIAKEALQQGDEE